jgi:hypothetical protein
MVAIALTRAKPFRFEVEYNESNAQRKCAREECLNDVPS